MAGKEYQIAFELKAKLESSYPGTIRKVMDNLEHIETTARAIEGIRISGDMVRPLREGLQAAEREFDQLRRMPRIDGIFTETVKELKEAVRESTQLHRNLQEIARIRMPSNMFGSDLQRYTRDMQELEHRMRELNDMPGPQGGGNGGGSGGEGAGGGGGLLGGLAGGSVVAGSGVAAIGGVAVVGGLALGAADDYQKAMSFIQGATLTTNEEMKDLREASKGVYSDNIGEGWMDVADAVSKSYTAFKLQGQALQDAAAGAILLRDSSDFDYTESIRSADVMVKTFGGDVNQAFSLFAQGAAKGINGAEDMLDSITEFSPAFKSIGYDAAGMLGVFANGIDAGVRNTDLIANAINEFSIKSIEVTQATSDAYKGLGFDADKMRQTFAKGGPEAHKAFQQVTQALEDMKDPVQQNTYGVSLFGTMFEEMGIKGFSALNDVNTQIDKSRDALAELKKVRYNSMGEALRGVGRIINAGIIIPISDKLLPLVQNFSDKISGWLPVVQSTFGRIGSTVSKTIDTVRNLFTKGFDMDTTLSGVSLLTRLGMDSSSAKEVVGTVKGIFDSVSNVVKGVKKLFTGEISIGEMFGFKKNDMQGVTSGFKDIVRSLMGHWASFGKNLLGVWPSIKGIFVSIGNIVKTVAPIFGTLVKTAVAGFKAVYNAVMPIATYLSGKLWPIIQNIFTYLGTQVFPQVSRLIAALVPQIMSIASKAQEAFGAIGGWISRMFEAVKPTLDSLFASFQFVWGAIKTVVSNAIDAIGGVISGLLTSLDGIIDFVTGVFSGDWGKAWQGVRTVFEGIFDGLGAVLVFPINVVVDAINAAIRGINKVNFDVPDWVPGIGGENFGFSIPEIPKIGGYAKGGYVDSPELAWVGEGRSPEWIIPENNSARSQGLLQAANRSMGGGAGATNNMVCDFNFSPTYIFNGNADKEAVQQMEKRTQQDFGREFAQYKRDRLRVSLSESWI